MAHKWELMLLWSTVYSYGFAWSPERAIYQLYTTTARRDPVSIARWFSFCCITTALCRLHSSVHAVPILDNIHLHRVPCLRNVSYN
ncbi:hypothetical protein V8C35DRAFT_288176 [Trichoderma chlorosporum]